MGSEVEQMNFYFSSDLNKIDFSDDIAKFFTDPVVKARTIDKLKLYYSKYDNIINSIRLYNDRSEVYHLYKDTEERGSSGDWLDDTYLAQKQPEIFPREMLVPIRDKYNYYLPIIRDNRTIGNFVITVDYKKYFQTLFDKYSLEDYQWQWLINDSGTVVYDNFPGAAIYRELNKLQSDLEEGISGHTIHQAEINGEVKELISSYQPVYLLTRDYGIIFSAQTDFFQKYIIRNSLFIVLSTVLALHLVIILFRRFTKPKLEEIEKLKKSQLLLENIIDEMPVGILIRSQEHEILKANKVAASIFSYNTPEDITGMLFPEVGDAGLSREVVEIAGAKIKPDQFIRVKKEVGDIIILRNSVPVHYQDSDAVMEILFDITLIETARKQEARANVAKSEFLARMSYEIRTPLNGIIGMTDMLFKRELPGDTKEVVGLLKRSTELLLGIINDILDFSKIESGKMILDEIPFNLRDELKYCFNLSRSGVNEDVVRIDCSVADDIPDQLIGDPYRLRQILINLMNRSILSTEQGEIRASCTIASANDDEVTIAFEIADTGKAYDKATLKKIFGEFLQADSKALRKYEDSGLGTVLSRQLIELMDGELTAESPSGLSSDPTKKGTKVRFTVKFNIRERISKSMDHSSIKSYADIRVLVIEGGGGHDEEVPGMIKSLGANPFVTGFQKFTIGQIKANLELEEGRYKCVVIIDEEEFDGFEVAAALQEHNLSQKFILIMISSNDQKGNFSRCQKLGIDHYIVKPVEIPELVHAFAESFPSLRGAGYGAKSTNMFRKDLKVLIVEDNIINQKVISKILNDEGLTVDLAVNGEESIAFARKGGYELIFMDLVLPGVDGYTAASDILSFSPKTLIVAITADSMPEARSKAEGAGIKEFITKPVRVEEIREILNRYFS